MKVCVVCELGYYTAIIRYVLTVLSISRDDIDYRALWIRIIVCWVLQRVKFLITVHVVLNRMKLLYPKISKEEIMELVWHIAGYDCCKCPFSPERKLAVITVEKKEYVCHRWKSL